MSTKTKYSIVTLGILVVLIGGLLWTKKSSPQDKKGLSPNLTPEKSITHSHGLGVDVSDPTKIYIATHHGLLVLKDEKNLYRIGESTDDYMGFSLHSNNPRIFFSSGHSQGSGNIGFQESEDGGVSWKKVSDGLDGPVDFHSMSVSPANPELIYGWFNGAVQRTKDEGKTWEKFATNFPIVSLAADPKDVNIVYAASQLGLYQSTNQAKDWTKLIEGFVSTVAINPKNTQMLISFSEKYGLGKSSNGGKDWATISEKFNGETPLYMSFSKQNSDLIYALTEKNSIYKSTSNGENWNKIK